MKTVHTESAYTGLFDQTKTESTSLVDDGDSHPAMLENEADQEKYYKQEAKVWLLAYPMDNIYNLTD